MRLVRVNYILQIICNIWIVIRNFLVTLQRNWVSCLVGCGYGCPWIGRC